MTFQIRVARVVKDTRLLLEWESLVQPAYSPYTAPSDYHLLRSMHYGLAGTRFRNAEEVPKWLNDLIAAKLKCKKIVPIFVDKCSFQLKNKLLPCRTHLKQSVTFHLRFCNVFCFCVSTVKEYILDLSIQL